MTPVDGDTIHTNGLSDRLEAHLKGLVEVGPRNKHAARRAYRTQQGLAARNRRHSSAVRRGLLRSPGMRIVIRGPLLFGIRSHASNGWFVVGS
jgi:hypothetical protein